MEFGIVGSPCKGDTAAAPGGRFCGQWAKLSSWFGSHASPAGPGIPEHVSSAWSEEPDMGLEPLGVPGDS